MLYERMRVADMIENVLTGQSGNMLVNNPILLRKKLTAALKNATKEEKAQIANGCNYEKVRKHSKKV